MDASRDQEGPSKALDGTQVAQCLNGPRGTGPITSLLAT
jgi:hypothetical protein